MNKHAEKRLNIIKNPTTIVEDLCYEDQKILKKSLDEFKKETIQKYFLEYGEFFVKEDIELMVTKAIDDFKFTDGLSLELSTTFKMDNMILVALSTRYKHLNYENDETALDILYYIINKYENIFLERYPSIPVATLENIIEDVFLNMNREQLFNVEVRKRIRKELTANR